MYRMRQALSLSIDGYGLILPLIPLHVDAAVRLELHALLLQQGPLPGPSRRGTAGAVYDAVAGVFAVVLGHGQDLADEPGDLAVRSNGAGRDFGDD